MYRFLLIIIIALACALPARAALLNTPRLSVTRTLLDPGQATTVWTSFYSDGIEKHLAELQAQPGLTVATPEQDVFLDGAHGQIVSWVVTADAPLRPGRYTMVLLVDGAQVDRIAVDVRPVGTWIWLSWVRKN